MMDDLEMDVYAPSRDARMWAMWCHLGSLSAWVGLPLGNVIVPLVIWLMKREEEPFVDYHGKESLNFHISVTIYMIVSAFLILVFVGILFLILIPIVAIVLTIIAAVKANDGELYRYPLTIRLIS